MQQVLCEIESTETGCFRTEDRTAPCHSLAGQHARMILARELLVHTIQESDLTSTYTYISCRNILIRTDTTPEFQHKGLTETHDLSVGFAYRIKVRTTFRTAHRQCSQGILKRLLKAQELKHRRSHRTMETKASFIRAYRRIELNAVTEVGLYLTLVIDPRYAEREDTIRFHHSLHDLSLLELGVLVVHLFNRLQYLLNRL